ncbi:MAG: hypothetical protein HRT68_05345 [Flavobacteriaceae bacterium]|nr:hypothetical protein [Flavobacteriaceae bacterium]
MNIYKTLLPLIAFGMCLIFILREWIIKLLLTEEFIEMENLFKWQLLGDFIKVMAMIIAHQFIAKRMLIYFIVSEILSLALFYFLSNYFIQDYGAEGVVLAHFVRYVIYFIVVLSLLRGHFFGKERAI